MTKPNYNKAAMDALLAFNEATSVDGKGSTDATLTMIAHAMSLHLWALSLNEEAFMLDLTRAIAWAIKDARATHEITKRMEQESGE